MLVFTAGLAPQTVLASKVLLLDLVSGSWMVNSSKVLVEAKEEEEEGRGEGGSGLIIFCCSPLFCPLVTFFRRKSANEAAGLLEAGDAGVTGAEMGAGGGGGAKELGCRCEGCRDCFGEGGR